jgi:hypothetical protein
MWTASAPITSTSSPPRGAFGRVLLDNLFDDEGALRSNRATVEYLNALATNEGLDLQARTGHTKRGACARLTEIDTSRLAANAEAAAGETELALFTDAQAWLAYAAYAYRIHDHKLAGLTRIRMPRV